MYVGGKTENSIYKKKDELADHIWKQIETNMNVMWNHIKIWIA